MDYRDSIEYTTFYEGWGGVFAVFAVFSRMEIEMSWLCKETIAGLGFSEP